MFVVVVVVVKQSLVSIFKGSSCWSSLHRKGTTRNVKRLSSRKLLMIFFEFFLSQTSDIWGYVIPKDIASEKALTIEVNFTTKVLGTPSNYILNEIFIQQIFSTINVFRFIIVFAYLSNTLISTVWLLNNFPPLFLC